MMFSGGWDQNVTVILLRFMDGISEQVKSVKY
jgi:hypothetical protein